MQWDPIGMLPMVTGDAYGWEELLFLVAAIGVVTFFVGF